MNLWQALKQVQYKLRRATWPDSPNNPVFASVHVTQEPPEESAADLRLPCAILRIQDGAFDPNNPTTKTEHLECIVIAANAGDQLGEYALLGGQRKSQGSGQGRGLVEVEEQLHVVTAEMTALDGVNIVAASSTAAEGAMMPDVGYICTRAYTLLARVTRGRTYPTPNWGNVLSTSLGTPGGGNTPVTVSWLPLIERFDLHPAVAVPALPARGSLALVRKQGSTPANPTDGTVVTLASISATSVVDSVVTGSGSWTYGLFANFDEFGDGVTSIRVSAPAVATVTV